VTKLPAGSLALTRTWKFWVRFGIEPVNVRVLALNASQVPVSGVPSAS